MRFSPRYLTAAAAVLAAIAPAASHAQLSGLAFEPSLGTLGLGLGISARVDNVPGLELAGSGHYLKLDRTLDRDPSKIDAGINLNRLLAAARYRVGGSGFYLTGGLGLSLSSNQLDGTARPGTPGAGAATINVATPNNALDGNSTITWNGATYSIPQITEPVTYGGVTYTPAEINTALINNTSLTLTSASIKVKYNTVTPYLGLGWAGDAGARGWSFRAEAGALFQGDPKVETTVNSNAPDAVKAATMQALQDDVNKVRDAASKVRIFPAVTFSATYRF